MATSEDMCGAPTNEGSACGRTPVRPGQPCLQHAGLAITDAQRDVAQRNATKHGLYATVPRTEEHRRIFQEAREATRQGSRAEVREELAALPHYQLALLMRWQEEHGPSPQFLAVHTAATKALERQAQAEGERGASLDEAALVRKVDELMRDPEFLLRRLPADKRERVRRVLQGEEPDAGGAGAGATSAGSAEVGGEPAAPA